MRRSPARASRVQPLFAACVQWGDLLAPVNASLAALLEANPWRRIPSAPPFVVDEDRDDLGRYVAKLKGPFELKLDLLPQPWTGDIRQATVLMLALNPGFAPEDYTDLQHPDYAEQWRLALSFSSRTPFYFLGSSVQLHVGTPMVARSVAATDRRGWSRACVRASDVR